MPYVSVWVDDPPPEPCLECEKREEQKDREARDGCLADEILQEWTMAQSRDDYQMFDEYLRRKFPSAYDFVLYGDRKQNIIVRRQRDPTGP